MNSELLIAVALAYGTVLASAAITRPALTLRLCDALDGVLVYALVFSAGACVGGLGAMQGIRAQGAASYAITDGSSNGDSYVMDRLVDAAVAGFGPAIGIAGLCALLFAFNRAIRKVCAMAISTPERDASKPRSRNQPARKDNK